MENASCHEFAKWPGDGDFSPALRFTLIAIADFADLPHGARPSRKLLATITGLEERTITTAIEQLTSKGFLKVLRVPGSPSRLSLNVELLEMLVREEREIREQKEREEQDPMDHAGSRAPGSTPGSTESRDPGSRVMDPRSMAPDRGSANVDLRSTESLTQGLRESLTEEERTAVWIDAYARARSTSKRYRGDEGAGLPKPRRWTKIFDWVEETRRKHRLEASERDVAHALWKRFFILDGDRLDEKGHPPCFLPGELHRLRNPLLAELRRRSPVAPLDTSPTDETAASSEGGLSSESNQRGLAMLREELANLKRGELCDPQLKNGSRGAPTPGSPTHEERSPMSTAKVASSAREHQRGQHA